jgi:hypothetical protein
MSEDQTQSYYQRNRERQLALAKEYRQKNREKYRAYWKIYYQEKKDILREKHKQYVRKNNTRLNFLNRTKYYPKHQTKKQDEIRSPTIPTIMQRVEEEQTIPMTIDRGNFTLSFD